MPEATTPRPLVPSSPHPRLPFHDRPIKPTKRFRSSHLWRGEESASFFRTLSSRAVRLNRYTANRRQHGCAERHPPSSPRPQLQNSQLLSMIDRPTDRPTPRPTHRSNRRHGSEVADIQAPHLRRRTGLGLTALIGDLALISSRPGQPAGRRAPASRFCFFQPDYCRCIGCTPSMGPCSHRYICRRIPIASEPYSSVKPAGANRPPAPSALWRCGARLAGVFPRAGKGKHGGATTWRSYNGPPCARETPLARSLSQLHCAGLYVRGCGPTFASSPFQPRQTDVRRRVEPRPSTLDPRPSTLDPQTFFAALL